LLLIPLDAITSKERASKAVPWVFEVQLEEQTRQSLRILIQS
jgi:hypothetical protein